MSVEIVHPLPIEALEGWARTMAITFLDSPEAEDQRRWRDAMRLLWTPEHYWGARDGDQWVGTLGASTQGLTVPGTDARIPADALTMVTVAATHRRRGLLTTMLTDSLTTARDRGDAVSMLWAAEWAIYWRFGYAPATVNVEYTLNPRRPGARIEAGGDGTVRQVSAERLSEVGPAIFDRAAGQRGGHLQRTPRWWSFSLGLDGFPESLVDGKPPIGILHEGPDGPDGFLRWVPKGSGDADGVQVVDFCTASDAAYRGLWHYLTSMDLVETIAIGHRPIDEPLRWLLPDGRALHIDSALDGLWLRLLDVPAALSARRYAVEDRLVLEVVDDDIGGFAAGRYVLDGGPDGAKCQASTVDTPDLRVHQRALAMAYLGGTSLHGQAIAGRVEELTPGALRRADALFMTPAAPWCATGF